MFDTLSDTDFRNLYNAVKDARLAGRQIIKVQIGNTATEKEKTVDAGDHNLWAQLAAEFRLRFPDEVGRRNRNTRTRGVFWQ